MSIVSRCSRLAPVVAVCLSFACATPPSDEVGRAAQPIINGATETGYPGVVKVLLQASGGTAKGICTGVLVGAKTVLTAAHCIALSPLSETLVEAGKIYKVVKAVGHPSWNASKSAYLNDIGLLVLDSAPPRQSHIASDRAPTAGLAVKLIGFGRSDPSDQKTAGTKRRGNKTIAAVSSGHFTVKGRDRNSANGDSGGAVFATIGGLERVVGIISGSTSDWTTSYHVRVDAFKSWLTTQAGGDIRFSSGGTNPTKPTVTITSPKNGATVPLDIAIEATATSSKTIAQVQAYVDGRSVGSLAAPPYRFAVQGMPPGQHTIRVTARDSDGQTGEASVTVTADATAPTPDSGVGPTPDSGGGAGGSDIGLGLPPDSGPSKSGDGGSSDDGGCAVARGGASSAFTGLAVCGLLVLVAVWRRRRRDLQR